MKTKRIILVCLAAVSALAFAACSESKKAGEDLKDAAGHAATAVRQGAEKSVDAVGDAAAAVDDAADELEHKM